jgi:hypothetical protein
MLMLYSQNQNNQCTRTACGLYNAERETMTDTTVRRGICTCMRPVDDDQMKQDCSSVVRWGDGDGKYDDGVSLRLDRGRASARTREGN